MMDDLVRDRVELKYALAPEEAEALTGRLKTAHGDPNFRTERGWVTTVYLDRPDGALARAALKSPSECVKVRLRAYFSPEGEPRSDSLWVELKERSGVVSRKTRFELPKLWVEPYLGNRLPTGRILACQSPRLNPASVGRAIDRIREIAGGPLLPMGASRYLRLAIEGGMPCGRLTLDRHLSYHLGPFDLGGSGLPEDALGPAAVEDFGGLVELKYRGGGPPRWCARALQGHRPVEYSKFLTLAALALSELMASWLQKSPAAEICHVDQLRRD